MSSPTIQHKQFHLHNKNVPPTYKMNGTRKQKTKTTIMKTQAVQEIS